MERRMSRRQPHCLQTYRKRNALTQEEVAFLLGCNTGAQVSQYERLRRQPGIEAMLACQIIFGAESRELFPVLWHEVELTTKKRARQMLSEQVPHHSEENGAKRKIKLLNDIVSRKGDEPAPLPWEKKALGAS